MGCEVTFFSIAIAQQNDVFVSYAHVDLAFASKIKEFLESYAIKWCEHFHNHPLGS